MAMDVSWQKRLMREGYRTWMKITTDNSTTGWIQEKQRLKKKILPRVARCIELTQGMYHYR